MGWQYTPYTIVLVLATSIGLVATSLTWRYREDPAARWAAYTNATITLWAGLHLVVVSSTVYEVKLAAMTGALATMACLVVAVFGYVLNFVGRDTWLTTRRLALLCLLPLSALVVLVTNPWHELYLVDPALERGTYVELTYGKGPLKYGLTAVYYGIVGVALGLLAQQFLRVRNLYRKITLVVFLAILLPVAGTVLSTFDLSPLPHYLLLPYIYTVTSVLALLAMTSVRFVRSIPLERFLARFWGSKTVLPLARDFVIEAVDNGIIILDDSGRIVDINSTGKRMVGAERPLGTYIGDAVHPDSIVNDDALRTALKEGRADLSAFGGELWVDTPAGERCYDLRITPLETGDTRAGTVILLHDITDRKRDETELRKREAELRRRKRSLETQTRKLEHQNERLDEFAGVVSHDLRNPLTVANGYLAEIHDIAADETDTVDPELVAEVQYSTDRMESIIEDALTLARQGKAITETEPVDIDAVASDAWDQIQSSSASLECDLADEQGAPMVVEGDRNRLLTVFENLFRNSVEHGSTNPDSTESTRDDHQSLTVSVGRLEDGTGFYVADDGTGIPADEREAVIEQGFSTNAEETGLGLAIVTDVIRGHGWRLEVTESETGGARFEVHDVGTVESADPRLVDESTTFDYRPEPGDSVD